LVQQSPSKKQPSPSGVHICEEELETAVAASVLDVDVAALVEPTDVAVAVAASLELAESEAELDCALV
jgi:hypothetical protein